MMKRLKIAHLFLAVLLLLVFACKKNSESTSKLGLELILGTTSGYPPYESVNAKGEMEGFDIDVAKAVAKKLNKKLVVKDMSFDALVMALDQGKFDIIMGAMSITSAREKAIAMVAYQGEIMKSYALVFWGSVPAQIKSIDDVKNYKNKTITTLTGTIMEEYLRQFPEVTAKPLEVIAEVIMDIQHKKSVAALLEPNITQDIMLKHKEIQKLEIPLPATEWVKGYGIGVKKENTKLLQQVQIAIDALKQEGVILALEKKWLKGISA